MINQTEEHINSDISVSPRQLCKPTLEGHVQIGHEFAGGYQCISGKTPEIDTIL